VLKEPGELRNAPIHRSLTRVQLLAGCDRGLLILSGLLCALLVFPAGLFRGDFFNVALGVAFMCLSITCLAKMAKTDPDMRRIYMRSLKYAAHYDGRPKYDKAHPMTHRRWD
jgi:type IV secretion system protein VirB3